MANRLTNKTVAQDDGILFGTTKIIILRSAVRRVSKDAITLIQADAAV